MKRYWWGGGKRSITKGGGRRREEVRTVFRMTLESGPQWMTVVSRWREFVVVEEHGHTVEGD